MKLTMKKRFESYAKNYKRRKSWQRVVSMLTCIIVFCTTYALILPAITLSGEATCGMDEHVHSDACYEVIEEQILTCSPVHNHTADCYEEGTLICGCADFVLHTHDKNCFSESGVILCDLAKLEEHIHTDDCYTVEEKVEGHLHEDACYSIELGECICGLEEQEGHTHDDACYGEQYLSCQEAEREGHTHEAACYGEATLSCTIEEDGQHTHGEACYTAELLCGETEDPGHAHGDDCYSRDLVCGEEEREGHAHTDDCYEEVRTLICELEEDGVITEELVLTCTKPEVTAHTHTDSCYEITKDEDGNEIRTLICTELEVLEHQHSAECLDVQYTTGMLTCLTAEHVHTEDCFPEVIEEYVPPALFSDSADDGVATINDISIFDVDPEVEIAFSDTKYDPNSESYDIKLKINWDLTNQDLKSYDAFHVALPEHMTIPDDLLNVKRSATDANKGGVVAFDYWFEKTADGDYVIHMEYRDSYIEVLNGEGCKSEIDFSGTVDKAAVNENGELELKWTDTTTTTIGKDKIDYPSDETANYDLHTQKQGSFNVVDNTLSYTVKVYSDKGTPSGNTISVTDIMTLNGVTVNGSPTVSITDGSGNAVSGAASDYQMTDGKPTITVTNLPALSAGGYYLITYTYSIEEIAAGSKYWPNNNVTATTPNPENDDPLTSTTGTTVNISKEMISKTGSFSAENELITWTITVNAAKDDIAGYVLTDDMLQNALSLSIVPADTDYYKINRDANNKISSIEFTAPEGETNTYTYTITYTTAQDQSTVAGNTTNKATLTPPEGDDETPSTSGDVNVWVPASGGIDKQFVSRDGSTFNWKVILKIPEGGIGAGTVVKDNTGYSWDSKADNHWMTPKQIYDLNATLSTLFSGIDYTLEFSADGWNWDTYDNAIADTSVSKYYCWRVTFNEDVPGLGNQDVTIDYSTTADLNAVTSTATYVNTASMGGFSDTDSTQYRPNVAKLDRNYNSGTTNISSTDGVIGWYVRITPDAETTQINLTDYIPEGVTLTKMGIGSSGNVTKMDVAASGEVSGWNNLRGTYTVTDTEKSDQTVTMTITPYDGTTPLPANSDIYVYFECTINDMPEPGSSSSASFKNEAVVDGIEIEQTQNVTVTIPATVVKMDRDGSMNDSTHSFNENDPTMGWYVRVYLPEGATDLNNNPVTVVDTLPDGLKLTKIGIGTSMYDARYGKDYSTNPATDLCVTVGDNTSGDFHGPNNAYASTYEINGQTVTVSVDNGGTDIAANSYIYIYLECEMTEAASGTTSDDGKTTTYTFPNSVTVNANGDTLGTDSQTQQITKNETTEQKVVDKTSIWDSGINQLQYSVLLNDKGADLDPAKDSITVVDQMIHAYDRWWNTKHSTLISSSVKLYYAKLDDEGNVLYDSDGTALTDIEVSANDWSWVYSDNYENVLNYTTDQIVNTITAVVPDGKPLVLKYIYEFNIDANWDTNFVVTNKATVYGETVSTDEVTTNDTWKYSEVTASATSSGTYTIHKVKQGNYNITLPGAEFTVYTYADGQPVIDENGNVVVYISGAGGLVKVSREDYFLEDVVYYIVETKAPSGYAIPKNPEKFYFYFSGDNEGSYAIPEGAIDLSLTFGVGYVENEVHENSIQVTKVWLDQDGNTIEPPEGVGSITFQLIQTDIYGNQVIYFPDATDGMTDEQKVYTISGDNDWKLTIEHLPTEDAYGNAYTYTAKEVEVEGFVSEIAVDANGNITISNRKAQTDGAVSVEKRWADGTVQEPVTVQLYQTTDKILTDYTAYLCFAEYSWQTKVGIDTPATFTTNVEGSGKYEITWNMQDFGFRQTDGIALFYIDIFDPNSDIYDNYNVSGLGVKTNGVDVAVSNTTPAFEREGNFTRIPIYRNGSGIVDPSTFVINADGSLYVTFTLTAKSADYVLPELSYTDVAENTGGVEFAEVTLSADNGWKHTWSGLPLVGTDVNGGLVTYSYYVLETSGGYDVSYSHSAAVNAGDNATIIITNSPRTPGDIIVDKKWADANGAEIIAPENSIEVDLYKMHTLYVEHFTWGGYYYYDDLEVFPGSVVTIKFNSIDGWAYDSRWNESSLPEGWTITKGNKVGQIYANDDWQPEVYEYTLVISVVESEKVTLRCHFNDLGPYDNIATSDASDKIVLGIQSADSVVIDHSLADKDGMHYLDTYTISADDNWQLKIADLEPGTYMLKEKESDYTVTYQVGSGAETTDGAQISLTPGSQQNVTVTNTIATTEITIDKMWLDDGQTRFNFDMLTFTLYQDGVEYSTGILYMEKDAEGNAYWETTITNLPKNHPKLDADGNVMRDGNGDIIYEDYVYTIKETPLDGYITEYSANGGKSTSDYTQAGVTGGGKITIINEQVTSIGVRKYWADGVSPTAVRMELWCYTSTTGAEEFQVPLDASGQVDYEALKNTPNVSFVRYASICDSSGAENSTSSSSKTFKNLPLFEFEGEEITTYYTYFIVEVASGYIKTYTEDNFITGGSYTITNDVETVDIGVDKQWNDGSTTSVDVSLYQVFTVSSTHTHSYTPVATAPTCEQQGYTTYTCDCGHTYKANYTDPTGHTWNDGVITVQPTETTTGLKVYTCFICGGTREEVLGTAEHSHSYTSTVTKEPTCTEQGIRTYTCTCGNSYTEGIAATGHSMGGWTVQTPATCTTEGTEVQTCSKCGHTETRTNSALGHTMGSIVQTTAPTCYTEGVGTATCSVCGVTETVSIDPTGDHDWDEGTVTKEATETETGIKTYKCKTSGCTATKTEDIPATGGGSTEIVLWSGSFTMDSSWNQNVNYFAIDNSVITNGGYLNVTYTTLTTNNSGLGVFLRCAHSWGNQDCQIHYEEKLDGTMGRTISISYDNIVSAVGSDNISKIVGINFTGFSSTITKVTWTPASTLSANSFNYTNRVYYAEGNSSNPLGGAYVGTKQVTPGTTTWWTDLPKYKLDENGNILGEYTYYVVETGGTEYDATYTYTGSGGTVTETEMSTGISSGKITVTNTQEYHYELPATGGSGTFPYTLGGIFLLMAGCVVLMYNHKKGRKGVTAP